MNHNHALTVPFYALALCTLLSSCTDSGGEFEQATLSDVVSDLGFIKADCPAGYNIIFAEDAPTIFVNNDPEPVHDVQGTSGNDCIIGTDGVDWIEAGSGDDWIAARGGDDRVFGGLGSDRIFGGQGDDTLRGDTGGAGLFAGADEIYGGSGDDMIYATDLNDDGAFLFGGRGDDLIGVGAREGDTAIRVLMGGPGDDRLSGSPGNEILLGGGGQDEIDGNGGNDVIKSGAEVDNVF